MRQKVECFCLLWYNYIVSDEDMYLHIPIAVKGQGKKNKLTFVKWKINSKGLKLVC